MNKQELVAQETETTNVLQVISRAAADPSVDIEKLERLLAMHERIVARQAEAAFNADMSAAQAAMQPIVKDAENASTSSMYAKLGTVIEKMAPVIRQYGFALSFGTADHPNPDYVRVTCRVSHRGGHSYTEHVDIPLDMTGAKGTVNKTRTHAFGSSVAYGRRYLTLMIFNVATKDDDGNAAGGELITEEQVANLEALIDEVKANRAFFLKFCKVESIEQIPAKKYSAAVRALEAKRK